MESLFQNKVVNAAAKFSDQINRLISANTNWYRTQGSALKIKFKRDIEEARQAAIKLHKIENTFDDDLNTFQNSLQIAGTTAFDLVDNSQVANQKSIAEAFGSKINNTRNELTAILNEFSDINNASIREATNKFHYDLNYYFDAKNIPNQDLVFETYNYFEKGDGAEFFQPLDFFNLLYWNYEFVNENIDKPFDIINHLRLIPIENINKHILIAFILKWFGGVPVNNLNSQYNTTLKLIESTYKENLQFANVADNEFVDHKDFMDKLDNIIKDNPKREQFTRLEKILNDSINNKMGTSERETEVEPYVFISHSSKDAEIIKAFTDKILQLVLQIKPSEIFCTSIEALSITSGEDFRAAIKDSLQRASHVIQFITSNYKKSEVCLNEMGAAWVLNTKVKPFILDPIGYSSVGFINSPNQLLKLDQKEDILKFIDEMKNDISLSTLHSEVNRHVEDFIKVVNKHKMETFDATKDESTNSIMSENNSETIFFNLNSTKEYYIKGSEEQRWENGGPVGEKGKGRLQLKNSVIHIERLNIDGRFVINFLRYASGNVTKEYIESNIYNHSVRIICCEFEAKTINGKHVLLIGAKKANSYDWIYGANTKVEISNSDWEPFKQYMHIPSNENFTIFIDDREVDKAPSSIQVKNFVIKEVF